MLLNTLDMKDNELGRRIFHWSAIVAIKILEINWDRNGAALANPFLKQKSVESKK